MLNHASEKINKNHPAPDYLSRVLLRLTPPYGYGNQDGGGRIQITKFLHLFCASLTTHDDD